MLTWQHFTQDNLFSLSVLLLRDCHLSVGSLYIGQHQRGEGGFYRLEPFLKGSNRNVSTPLILIFECGRLTLLTPQIAGVQSWVKGSGAALVSMNNVMNNVTLPRYDVVDPQGVFPSLELLFLFAMLVPEPVGLW